MRPRTEEASILDVVPDSSVQLCTDISGTILLIRLNFVHLLTFFYDCLLVRLSLEVIFQA